jgi:hypothetical protein
MEQYKLKNIYNDVAFAEVSFCIKKEKKKEKKGCLFVFISIV